jgi:uncharacterized protein
MGDSCPTDMGDKHFVVVVSGTGIGSAPEQVIEYVRNTHLPWPGRTGGRADPAGSSDARHHRGLDDGAYLGGSYASKLSVERLERLILVLLVVIGLGLIVEGFVPWTGSGLAGRLGFRLLVAGVLGVGIGVVSSTLGVAGGELIIPTLVFVFGAPIKIAGTASILISLPTVGVGLVRYWKNGAFKERADLSALILPMGLGSIVGAGAGGLLVPYVPAGVLKVGLGMILIASAVRIFRGEPATEERGRA